MSKEAMASLEDGIMRASYDEKLSLLVFIATQVKNAAPNSDAAKPSGSEDTTDVKPVIKRELHLGGWEKGFWIADDFDETPECMKAYT